jgi:hypothetical protein
MRLGLRSIGELYRGMGGERQTCATERDAPMMQRDSNVQPFALSESRLQN